MKATLCGLILAGGESRRMGRDKLSLVYDGVPNGVRLAGLLGKFCREIFLSRRPGQTGPVLPPGVTLLLDRYSDLGPLGGVLTAMGRFPDKAWLAVACDLPHLKPEVLATLLDARHPDMSAVAFRTPDGRRPEPLCTIYEPAARARLAEGLGKGETSLSRMLANMDARLLPPPDRSSLLNVNTPEEYERSLRKR